MKTLISLFLLTIFVMTLKGASLNNTIVLAGSGGNIIDAGGNVWTIAPGVVNGTSYSAVAYENGKIAGINYNVAELAYVNGAVWHVNLVGDWYKWTGSTWVAGT